MIKLKKHEKILGFAVLVLMLLFIFNALVVNPLREKLNSAAQEIERSKLVIRKYLELGRYRDTLLEGKKRIERYLSLKGTEEEKTMVILSKIEAQARKSGLSILDMNPAATVKTGSKPAVYRIQLRGEAEMAKIFDFIYNLENADILFKIDKLNLSAKEEGSKVLKIEASILAVSLS